MNMREIKQLKNELQALLEYSKDLEAQLRSAELSDDMLVNKKAVGLAINKIDQLIDETVELALALSRVDFRDEYYTFLRAIDGDTIVVRPPEILQPWLKDIHVRLYGVETPEHWEELGPQYQQHLEELCLIDASSKLLIVWERERIGTNYEGFPRTSFERGIGHIFFQRPNQRFFYVNGLLHVLPHVSSMRKGKSLLRGKGRLSDYDLALPWRRECLTKLEGDLDASRTLKSILAQCPPICLIDYSIPPSLDPRGEGYQQILLNFIAQKSERHCPFSSYYSAIKEGSVYETYARVVIAAARQARGEGCGASLMR